MRRVLEHAIPVLAMAVVRVRSSAVKLKCIVLPIELANLVPPSQHVTSLQHGETVGTHEFAGIVPARLGGRQFSSRHVDGKRQSCARGTAGLE